MTATQLRAWKALEKEWAAVGFEQLSIEDQQAIALFWLDGEVANGGLHQYFSNSSGDLCPHAVSGLRRLGANQALEALESAISKLGADLYPTDRVERNDMLDANCPVDANPFDDETHELRYMSEPYFKMVLDDLVARQSRKTAEQRHPLDAQKDARK